MRAHIYFLFLIGAAGDMKSMNRKINGGRSAFSETFSIHLKSERKIYSQLKDFFVHLLAFRTFFAICQSGLCVRFLLIMGGDSMGAWHASKN